MKEIRTSVTDEMAKELLTYVDGIRIKNRSHLIARILEDFLNSPTKPINREFRADRVVGVKK